MTSEAPSPHISIVQTGTKSCAAAIRTKRKETKGLEPSRRKPVGKSRSHYQSATFDPSERCGVGQSRSGSTG